MSKKRLNFSQVANLRLRDDGTAAEFTLTGKNNQSLTVDLASGQIDELVSALIQLAEAARFNRGMETLTPKTVRNLRPVFLCQQLEIALNPDASASFLIDTPDGEQIQVLFPAHEIALIRHVLTGNGSGFQRPN
ncbi:MAG TPA: hypothetical protein VFS77_07585 [Pyrinomonadaceae bacterium]|nr:hypothetical protein [Pyrinomonadaceae bacterium]